MVFLDESCELDLVSLDPNKIILPYISIIKMQSKKINLMLDCVENQFLFKADKVEK